MRCACNELGYSCTKTGRVVYDKSKKNKWKLRRVWKIFSQGYLPDFTGTLDEKWKTTGWPGPEKFGIDPDADPWSSDGFATILDLWIKKLQDIKGTFIIAKEVNI